MTSSACLFQPGLIPQTGYRLYSADRLPRLNCILTLRDLGFSLDEISEMVEKAISPEDPLAHLERQRAEIERHIYTALQIPFEKT